MKQGRDLIRGEKWNEKIVKRRYYFACLALFHFAIVLIIAMSLPDTKYKPKFCLCGCGELTKVRAYPRKQGGGFSYFVGDYIMGHGRRNKGGFRTEIYAPRLCACGCGIITEKRRGRFNYFIRGHENFGRTPWNKGKEFSEEVRKKMSIARMGKEPANKAHVNLEILRQLYVKDGKTARMISKELRVSYDAVKNRIRAFGWSRSTKESCSTPLFRETMRHIRVAALSSQKAIASPNKLEQLVYHALDKQGIPYEKQVPLFGKFVIDVFFPQRSLVLEIFGRYWHTMPVIQKKDFSKKRYLEKCGYRVEEIWDDEIRAVGIQQSLEKVLSKYDLV